MRDSLPGSDRLNVATGSTGSTGSTTSSGSTGSTGSTESARACLENRRRLLRCPPQRLIEHCLQQIRDGDHALRAWVATRNDAQQALRSSAPREPDRSALSDARHPDRPAPIPFGVKDVIDVAGFATRAGSRALATAAACDSDAVVVARLRAAGLVPIGKTVTTEFAYTDPSITHNPFDPRHTPGGSSSGSAAAVGGGMVPLALGTQTGGSVCRPAAFCGTYAFKPSTGRTPAAGVVPFAPSYDTVGVFGLRLDWTVAAGLAIVDGEHAMGLSVPPVSAHSTLRVGVLRDAYFNAMSDEPRCTLERVASLLAAAGHAIVPVELGLDFEQLRVVHRRVMQYEAHRAHGHLLNRPPGLLGPQWRGALLAGANIADRDYQADLRSIERARTTMLLRIEPVDCLLLPPVLGEAPRGLESTGDAGLIIPWTYARTPLAVLPTGLSERGLPLAVMIAGKPDQDRQAAAMSLSIGALLEAQGMTIDREWRH